MLQYDDIIRSGIRVINRSTVNLRSHQHAEPTTAPAEHAARGDSKQVVYGYVRRSIKIKIKIKVDADNGEHTGRPIEQV